MDKYDDRDKDYAKLRNSLIPEAEKYTNKHCGAACESKDDAVRDKWVAKWNRTFHRRMDHLYALMSGAADCPACKGTGKMAVHYEEAAGEA